MVCLGGCNTLQSIEVINKPIKIVYGQGQQLDTSGLTLMAHYKKNSEEIKNTSLMRTTFNSNTPGVQTVTVTFGEGRREQRTTFTVTVIPAARLTIRQGPTEAFVFEGDNLNPAGLIAWVDYDNEAVQGMQIGPDRLTFTGFNSSRAGAQTVTADFFGKQATFQVTVAAFIGITLTYPPEKTDYFTGEDIDLKGIVVMGKWQGNLERPVTTSITQANISNFDKNRPGRQDVVITYMGSTASFPVTVTTMQVLTITRPPTKGYYNDGERLDITGMQLQGTRTGSGSIEMIDISRAQITGYERFISGNQTITVTVGGKSDTFRVTVGPSTLVGTWNSTYKFNDVSTHILTMTENTWVMTYIPSGDTSKSQTSASGTYTRDTNTGNVAAFTYVASGGGFASNAPRSAELRSPRELIITGAGFTSPTPFIKQ